MVWGAIREFLRVESIFAYNSCLWNELFNFASTPPPQSVQGSLPKTSEARHISLLPSKKLNSNYDAWGGLPGPIKGGLSERSWRIGLKRVSYEKKCFSTSQNDQTPTSRPSLGVFPTQLDITSRTISTEPSELPDSIQILEEITTPKSKMMRGRRQGEAV